MATKQTEPTEVKIPLLHQAEALINGQREADYGGKLQNFTQIAMGFNMVLATKLNSPITPDDVALLMTQVKVARLAKSPLHTDSIMDIAGYAGCLAKLQEERAAGIVLPGLLQSEAQILQDA